MNNTDSPQSNSTKPASNNGQSSGTATIGASIKILGDVSGKEDLVINGTVEGTVDFRESNVTVGEQGKVNANITAKNINVAGELKGELRGSEQVTIKPSGRVTGDIRSPRVVLNDGCQFKGLVDMEDKPHPPGEIRNTIPMGGAPNKSFADRASAAVSPTLTRRKL